MCGETPHRCGSPYLAGLSIHGECPRLCCPTVTPLNNLPAGRRPSISFFSDLPSGQDLPAPMNMEHLLPVGVPCKEWFEGCFNNRQPNEKTSSRCAIHRQQLLRRQRYDLLAAKNNSELMSTWPKMALAVVERERVASLKAKQARKNMRSGERRTIEAQSARALIDMPV